MRLTVHSTLVVTTLSILAWNVVAFEFAGYCKQMCMYGQGGNLCKCSAVHFAGKRTMIGTPTLRQTDPGQVSPDQEDLEPRQLHKTDGYEDSRRQKLAYAKLYQWLEKLLDARYAADTQDAAPDQTNLASATGYEAPRRNLARIVQQLNRHLQQRGDQATTSRLWRDSQEE